MTKKIFIILLIILFLLVPSVLAQPTQELHELFNAKELQIDLTVKSGLKINRMADSALEFVEADMTFSPKNTYKQSVIKAQIEPESKEVDDMHILYFWPSPTKNYLPYSFSTTIKIENKFIPIKQKIKYPFTVPGALKKYTQPAEIIDSDNEDIANLASSLATGEDDLYKVVFNIAQWVKENVEYDLTTVTSQASQKASWVLEHKEGVCDEITSLFVALLRALGIPAKFVSGVSYTNLEIFKEKWGPHGWAEVYFPDAGWVEWDVTYGQYGFIDPTHIKLKEAVDAGDPVTQFKWKGRNVKIESEKLDIKADLKKTKGKIFPPIQIQAVVSQKEIGFGSYNLVEAIVQNLKDSYISTTIAISQTKNLQTITPIRKTIMLKPKKKRSFYWILKVEEGMKEDYIYTFPILVHSIRNATSEIKFTSKKDAPVYSFDDMNKVIVSEAIEEDKEYSKKVILSCGTDKEQYLVEDSPIVSCIAKNTGDKDLKNIDVCFENQCRKIDLMKKQKKLFEYNIKDLQVGTRKYKFHIFSDDVIKSTFIDIVVLDKPKIEIAELDYPLNIDFNQNFAVNFLVKKASIAIPEKILITFRAGEHEQKYSIERLEVDKQYQIKFAPKTLFRKQNSFNILVEYEDERHKKYKTQKSFTINIANPSFGQKVNMLVLRMEYRIRGWLGLR